MYKNVASSLLLFLLVSSLHAKTYYVSLSGNDAASGTSHGQAWASIAKVNATLFLPGDTILFEGGSTFEGGIYFFSETGEKGEVSEVTGTAEKPVVFSSYGAGRAIISSDTVPGFKVYNGAGFVVKNLIFQGAGWEKNKSFGVEFYMDMPDTLLEYIVIDSLEVLGYREAGISFGSWDQTTGGIKNVSVTHSKVHDNGDAGIASYSQGVYCHKNIYIGYNRVFNNKGLPQKWWSHSGNGIVLGGVDGAIIEFCLAYNNGGLGAEEWGPGGPFGIWGYQSKNLLIQYNESFENRTNVHADGGGFDIEGCTNSIIQYNYSHDNDGPGFLVGQYSGAPPSQGNIIRYNISENDIRKGRQGALHIFSTGSAGGLQNIEIYNNTIYVSSSENSQPKALRVVNQGMQNVQLWNNSFYTNGNVEMIYAFNPKELYFYGNNYWAINRTNLEIKWDNVKYTNLQSWREATGQEMLNGRPTGFSVDPKLKEPGKRVTIADPTKLHTLRAYELQEDSPLIGKALDLQKELGIDPGKYDFFGNSIENRKDLAIGAHQPTENSRLCLHGGLVSLAFGPEEEGTYTGEGVLEESYFDPKTVGEGNHPVQYSFVNEAGENQVVHHTLQVVDAKTTSWTGADGNWFNSDNWSNCVPTPLIDASIRAPAEGEPLPVVKSQEKGQVKNLIRKFLYLLRKGAP